MRQQSKTYPESFNCPRQEGLTDIFVWAKDPSIWIDDETCSYCGSLHPDIFMERVIADNVTLIPTDKDYKVYIRTTDPEKQFKQSFTSESKWITELRAEAKFYFYHLSDEQKYRFVELYNDKTVKVGYPGYFYVLPYFCKELK